MVRLLLAQDRLLPALRLALLLALALLAALRARLVALHLEMAMHRVRVTAKATARAIPRAMAASMGGRNERYEHPSSKSRKPAALRVLWLQLPAKRVHGSLYSSHQHGLHAKACCLHQRTG